MTVKDGGDWPKIFESFYAAALDADLWISTLAKAANSLDVAGVSIVGPPHVNVPTVHPEVLDEMASDYLNQGWYKHNDRMINSIRASRGGEGHGQSGLVSNEILIAGDPHMKQSAIQQEFFKRHRLKWFVGGEIRLSRSDSIYLSIDRFDRQERFTRAELDVSDLICQHLKIALKIVHAIEGGRISGALQSFELLGKPAILLDADMRIVTMTLSAESYFPTLFALQDGRLSARDPASRDALRRRVAAVSGHEFVSGRQLPAPIAIRRRNNRPVVVTVAPYRSVAPQLLRLSRAILLIQDPDAEAGTPSIALIRDALGLTFAEARLASALAGNATLGACAKNFGVSQSTIRNQLSAIFLKTGTRRQVELVRIVQRLLL